jgi:hypothetical protein
MNEIIDMSLFVEAKSDQLNADDLIGGPRTITVRKVTGNDGDQPISIWFDGDNGKPWRPCKTMRRVLLAVWGRNAADYVGRAMTLYRDDTVQFGGLNTGGIRISHMSDINKETVVVVMKTKGKKAPFKVLPLVAERRQSAQPATGKSDVEQWADKFMARATACQTDTELNALVSKELKWLDKLPELLRADCDAAVSERLVALMPGREAERHGDQFPDDGF